MLKTEEGFEGEELNQDVSVEDNIIIENMFKGSHYVVGVQAQLLQLVPLHDILETLEAKIKAAGMVPIKTDDDDTQLFMIAYGTPDGEYPEEEDDDDAVQE